MLNYDEDKKNTIDNATEDEDVDLEDLEKMSGGAGSGGRSRGILTPEI